MNEKLTEIVFIIDQSGSMSGLENDTIGGFNSMIQKQKNTEGEAIVSTILFNHKINVVHDRIDIKEINNMTSNDYQPNGTTSLLDAIGSSITHIIHVYADTLKEDRPSKVVFAITTDGMENSSQNFSYRKIKQLIEETQQQYHWEFLFLGANIDAFNEGKKLGIDKDRIALYTNDHEGIKRNYRAINNAIQSLRTTNNIKKDWNNMEKKG
jgi:uncharacterized protein YegL